jgi:hypothetical protein
MDRARISGRGAARGRVRAQLPLRRQDHPKRPGADSGNQRQCKTNLPLYQESNDACTIKIT